MKDFLNQPTDPETYLFISAGKFNYNLFRHGRNVAAEDTPIDHRILSTHMSERKNKVITSYNYHKGVERFFKNCRFVLVDRHGKQATKREESKEIVVANF